MTKKLCCYFELIPAQFDADRLWLVHNKDQMLRRSLHACGGVRRIEFGVNDSVS